MTITTYRPSCADGCQVLSTALYRSRLDELDRLARIVEYRDEETGAHIRRIGDGAAVLARALGRSDAWAEQLAHVARLHDVGKIAIGDAILRKPGKLTPAEWEQMKLHTTIGAAMLRPLASDDVDHHHCPLPGANRRRQLLLMASTVAATHHERWDGTGYPRGLKGQAIPLAGRIVAVVDVFDALTHARPYKPAWSVDDACAEIERAAGRQFDPAVAAAFLRTMSSLLVLIVWWLASGSGGEYLDQAAAWLGAAV